MSLYKHHTTENTDTSGMDGTESGFGKRDDTVLSAAFTADIPTAEEITAQCKEILQGEGDGTHVDPNGYVLNADNYWGKIEVEGAQELININYVAAPDISGNTATDDSTPLTFGAGGGAPESPYVPPLTSPGAGNTTATTQTGMGSTYSPTAHIGFGSGDGGLADPADQTIKGQKIGDYTKGESS